MLKVATFTLLFCLGLLLLNNGFAFDLSASFIQFLRVVGGFASLIAAVALVLEETVERMVEIPCPSDTGGCKYAPNCHLSIHHEYPRRTVETRLQRKFSEDPRNKVRSCRLIHDLLDTLPPPPFPDEKTMYRFLGI